MRLQEEQHPPSRRRKGEEGLTLIELLIVVTIIGILAAIVSVSVGGVTTTTNEKARQTKLQSVQSAVDAYRLGESTQGGTMAAFPSANSTANCRTTGVVSPNIDGTVTAFYDRTGKTQPATGTVSVDVDGTPTTICSAAGVVNVVIVNIGGTNGLASKGYLRQGAATSTDLGTATTLAAATNLGFQCLFTFTDTPTGNTGPPTTDGVGRTASPTASAGKVIACSDNFTTK